MGRGTSNDDGFALALATTEYLASVGCRSVFATHFHQLCGVASRIPNVGAAQMGVEERVGALDELETIEFTYALQPGTAGQSYGLQVAALSGFPPEVVERAASILSATGSRSAWSHPFARQLREVETLETAPGRARQRQPATPPSRSSR